MVLDRVPPCHQRHAVSYQSRHVILAVRAFLEVHVIHAFLKVQAVRAFLAVNVVNAIFQIRVKVILRHSTATKSQLRWELCNRFICTRHQMITQR